MALPPAKTRALWGSGQRMGVDRDGDTILDDDE